MPKAMYDWRLAIDDLGVWGMNQNQMKKRAKAFGLRVIRSIQVLPSGPIESTIGR